MAMSKKCLKASAAARRNPGAARMVQPYIVGDTAWHNGQPQTANPYTAGTEDHTDWADGWSDAADYAATRAA